MYRTEDSGRDVTVKGFEDFEDSILTVICFNRSEECLILSGGGEGFRNNNRRNACVLSWVRS